MQVLINNALKVATMRTQPIPMTGAFTHRLIPNAASVTFPAPFFVNEMFANLCRRRYPTRKSINLQKPCETPCENAGERNNTHRCS